VLSLSNPSSGNSIIGLVALAVPAVAWVTTRPAHPGVSQTNSPDHLDPAAQARRARESAKKHIHEEDRHPEDYKAPFGVVHKPKRVDGPPDSRNLKDLAERNRAQE
jgi:hypothetical protein